MRPVVAPERVRRRSASSLQLLILFVLALGLLATGRVAAQDSEDEARKLESMLIAPCCFTQQVSVHHSPAADELRRDIRRRLAAGETREQILAAYVAQYGKRILAEPPAEGSTRALHMIPPLALVLTVGLVVVFLRRFTAREGNRAAAPASMGLADDRLRTELDDQLRDLD